MGKLASTSPPPIQKTVSWGSWHSPLIITSPNVPTTYREEGLVGKLPRALNVPTTYREEVLVGKFLCPEVPGLSY